MNRLHGHDAAWHTWLDAIASDRMHHAWLLSGPKGIGKGLFARAAAARLVAVPGVAEAASSAHPDIIVLDHRPANDAEEEKKAEGKPFQNKRNITIEQVRRMQTRLTTRPTLGSKRAIIIDPADDLEKGAVNALLKSLEEPPVGTCFLLVTHRPGRLLPTVRSRCRTLRFSPLTDAQVDSVLCDRCPSADHAARAAALAAAQGSPGVALEFVAQDLGPLHGLMVRLVRDGDDHFTLRGAMAEAIGTRPDRARQQAVLDLARAMVAAELAGSSQARQAQIITAFSDLTRLSGQIVTFNFDPALMVMEIGGLLASLAMPREAT